MQMPPNLIKLIGYFQLINRPSSSEAQKKAPPFKKRSVSEIRIEPQTTFDWWTSFHFFTDFYLEPELTCSRVLKEISWVKFYPNIIQQIPLKTFFLNYT